MKSAILSVVLSALAAASPAPQGGQFSLGGVVTNSITGEPIQHAIVQILSYSPPAPAAPGQVRKPPSPFVARTFSDSSGAFNFRGLSPGNYTVSAQKPEFIVDNPDGTVPTNVPLTASVSGVRIQLLPLGVVTGKVVDQDGDPVYGVSVVVVSFRTDDGLRHAIANRTATTDERGVFRLWNLMPGRYYLKAAGMSGNTLTYVGDDTPQYFADQGFAPSYYGGGRTLDAATPLEITAGNEAHADLMVQMEPAHAIRGVLGNYVEHRTVKLELLKFGESIPATPASINGANGRFEIQGMLSGDYILHATQDEATADAAIKVSGSDLDGVAITLLPGIDLKVHTFIANPETKSDADADSDPVAGEYVGRVGAAGFCHVTLHPADGRSNSTPLRSQLTENGDFTIHGVTAGTFRSVISCFGAYAQSATLGTQDLLLDPMVKVNAGVELAPIEIVARIGGGAIEGKLTVAKTEAAGNFTVLAVPQFTESTGPVVSPVFDAGEPGGEHAFTFENLAPGSYLVYAFAGRNELEFRNPKFLQALTGGTRLQVDDKSEKSIEITELIR